MTQPEKPKMKNSDRSAFPTNNRMYSEMAGLSKREYFAAMAMQGLCCNIRGSETPDEIAKASIKIADELLKQLES